MEYFDIHIHMHRKVLRLVWEGRGEEAGIGSGQLVFAVMFWAGGDAYRVRLGGMAGAEDVHLGGGKVGG